eukprot:COSAG05_NODE_12794_length_454_cov_1.016901_1_plen_70_part_01
MAATSAWRRLPQWVLVLVLAAWAAVRRRSLMRIALAFAGSDSTRKKQGETGAGQANCAGTGNVLLAELQG